MTTARPPGVDLFWIPLGAGAHIIQRFAAGHVRRVRRSVPGAVNFGPAFFCFIGCEALPLAIVNIGQAGMNLHGQIKMLGNGVL